MDLSNNNIIHVKDEKIEYLQFRVLNDFNVVNAYTLCVKGIDFKSIKSIESYKEEVEKNYGFLCDSLKIDRNGIIRPKQTHSDHIKIINNVNDDIDDIDGVMTDKKDLNFVLTFADCTPIFLFDKKQRIIANVHSGWKGTLQKIGQKAVYKMIKEFDSNPEDIIACIGPCIQKCHFEVSDDVKELFEKEFEYLKRNDDIIEKSKYAEGKYYIDTTLINKLILKEAGLREENIIDSGICTACNSNYMFSYRKSENKDGRNIAVLGLK